MSSASEAFVNVAPAVPRGRMIYRHTLLVRFTHWINAICLAVLLMSGLQIFNAHPALYWGNRSEFDKPLLAMTAQEDSGGSLTKGVTTILGKSFTTTGVLGRRAMRAASCRSAAFPAGSQFLLIRISRPAGAGISFLPGCSC